MHVGIITGEYPPMQGGIGDYSRLLARHLVSLGAQVSILTSLQAASGDADIAVTNAISAWDGRAWLQARAWARERNINILSLQYQTAAFGMSPWVHFLPDVLRSLPFVTTFHDLRYPYLFPKAGTFRPWIVRRLAQESTAVITTNDEDAAQLQNVHLHSIIPIGSNLAAGISDEVARATLRTRWAKPDEFLIGYFGLINRTKGVDTLVEALKQLRACAIPCRLLIVGGTEGASDPNNAAYMNELRAQIAADNLHAYIDFTGFLSDTAAANALSVCDVVALPYTDGTSLRRGSLMAALALGCAIVTSIPQQASDTFNEGENMLLVPPNDPTALAGALSRLYQDAALRHKLRQGAASTAQRFAWSKIAQDHLTFFNHVLEANV
jgi:glycosyltransferase involved in cell wall biosynthesis